MQTVKAVRTLLFVVAALAILRMVFNAVFEDSLIDAYVEDNLGPGGVDLAADAAPAYPSLGILSMALGLVVLAGAAVQTVTRLRAASA